MAKIIWYEHHGRMVAVDENLKGKHGEHCLCFRCSHFKPDTPENCDLAEQNFRACKINDMTMPVWECPQFAEKD